MHVERRQDFKAVILRPEVDDDPEDLEDLIHDYVLLGREEPDDQGQPSVTQVVLDLSGVAKQGPWMKAAGPEIPDVNLRLALGLEGFVTARALKLTALFEWYPDVETALRGGV